MKLPNASAARVDVEKLTDYLLSESHPVGRSKAKFFRGLGFAPERLGELIGALVAIARSEEVVDHEQTPFGTKYVIDGRIQGRDRSAMVRTVWVDERNAGQPRLVTAYPAPSGER